MSAEREALAVIKESRCVEGAWYRAQYPDVAALRMDPAEHYLKYGAAMGRDPGRFFSTRDYLAMYPDVAKTGMNPVLHYALIGRGKGYRTKGSVRDPARQAREQVEDLRQKLLTFGFTEQPLLDLEEVARSGASGAARAMAARELALWHMRARTEDGYRLALEHIAAARRTAPDLRFRTRLSVAELLCHHALGQVEEGRAAYHRAALAGEASADLMLAFVNLQDTPTLRLAWINQALQRYAIAPLRLGEGSGPSLYDRLTAAEPLAKVADGPRVTVLLAAYEAEDTLPTALRSLQEQTWQNLEILVIDDCSPGPGTAEVAQGFAAQDPRIRLIRMDANGGAYVARNAGLDQATGRYVTIHDADDWSHPSKIETQVRFLEANPIVQGCTSEQARAGSDLGFTRWTGSGHFIIANVSSFMFRRQEMRDALGYWDTARFSSDNELRRRFRAAFGQSAVVDLPTGPLSFQRTSASSIVADEFLGINGYFFGARKEYLDAQRHHHASGRNLRYSASPVERPFPCPRIMRADRAGQPSHFDVVIASDFRMEGGSVMSCVQELRAARRGGLRVGVVEMYRYDLGAKTRTSMLPVMRNEVDGDAVCVLAYGESATANALILRYPPVLQHRQRYLPSLEAKAIRVVINQPPVSDYSERGVKRYDFATCARNLREQFGRDAVWHPNGPMVRQAILEHHAEDVQHVDLSPEDWHNIIHLPDWARPPRVPRPGARLRIGRHSRDAYVKWPARREDILAVYPEAPDVEVHVLGGAATPSRVIGHTPRNWVVHGYGTLSPKEFLADLDLFVFFAHPDWVESFPRTVLEAMAVGVPVILPPMYQALFGDCALYATPDTALDTARRLHADPAAYTAQVNKAQAYLQKHYSYDTHAQRIKDLA
jgi:glycosyltransferase involved in cell wall biosynthesis